MKPGKKKTRTLEDYLIERIKKSGYPLEIEISNLLERGGYVVFNTQYYFDEATKQGRDIDIYAMPLRSHPLEEKLAPFNVRTELAIECKKSETHAWVFYTRPRIPMSSIYITGQYHTSVPELKDFSTESFQWLFKRECLDLLCDKLERIAITYDEIKKKKIEKETVKRKEQSGSSRREIFEAITQLVKFTRYEIHQIFDRISKISKPSSYLEHVVVFFPIIVFDGDMFEVNFDSGEPKPEKKNHISLATHYRRPYCREVKSFRVDIVHRAHFSEFMKILKVNFYGLRERMLQKFDELVKSAQATRQKYESETETSTFG